MSESSEINKSDFAKPQARVEMLDQPELGYKKFCDFIKVLQNKYPGKLYPGKNHLNDLDPNKVVNLRHKFEAYEAYFGEQLAGMAIGSVQRPKDQPKNFYLDLIVMDPEFENPEIAKKLMAELFSKYEKIRLVAYPFGKPTTISQRQRNRDVEVLIRYYKLLGFKQEYEPFKHAPGGALQMVWEKKAGQTT